jgi:hypothetical protein
VTAAVVTIIWGIHELWRHKAIAFHFLERSSFRSAAFKGDEDLQLFYKGKVVSNPYRLYFTVKNTGTDSIRSDDFDKKQPISMECPVPVLKVEVIAKKPSDLDVAYSHDGKRVILQPSLFNAGEEFTVCVLTDGDPGWPHPSCRIVDVKSVSVIRPDEPATSKEAPR